jgi:hypothetical protein
MNARNAYIIQWKDFLIQMYGQQQWARFWRKVSEKDTFFVNRLSTTEVMPIEKFLLFMHDIIRFFWDDHEHAYQIIGEKDAEFTFAQERYSKLSQSHEYEKFAVELFSSLWRKQFDYGAVAGYYLGTAIDIRIAELPLRHPYFESHTIGFVKKALYILGASVVGYTCIKGFERKNTEIHYRFHFH